MCAKYYENPTVLSRVIAKNVGDVFFETQCSCISQGRSQKKPADHNYWDDGEAWPEDLGWQSKESVWAVDTTCWLPHRWPAPATVSRCFRPAISSISMQLTHSWQLARSTESFPVAALTVWNSLPAHQLRSTQISCRQFRDGLKSHLFRDAYFWSSENIRYQSVNVFTYLFTALLSL